MTITDKTLIAWRDWIIYAIANSPDSILTGMQIRMRDTEEIISYPSITIYESAVSQMNAGGIEDSNVFSIDISTIIETIPGDDEDLASSRDTHDEFRTALGVILNDGYTREWVDSRSGISCFRVLTSSPETMVEDKRRATKWTNSATCCDN